MEEKDKFREWYNGKGRDFFLRSGVKPGAGILEFGSGGGVYTVPLAQASGSEGIVCAAESNHDVYDELKERLKAYSASNVRICDTNGKINFRTDRKFDFFVLFDTAHYYGKEERARLYAFAFNVLDKNGILLFFPKHCLGDSRPQGDFGTIGIREIKAEVEKQGFVPGEELREEIIHDNSFGFERILSFIKK
ncbi:MAG: class I SAM-dependent methyltransferase [Candidatus Goldiibacteriota bacterium]